MKWSAAIRYAHSLQRRYPDNLSPAEEVVFWRREARFENQPLIFSVPRDGVVLLESRRFRNGR